jgi:hypothetical protein
MILYQFFSEAEEDREIEEMAILKYIIMQDCSSIFYILHNTLTRLRFHHTISGAE